MSSTRRRALFSIIVVTIVLTTPEETSALPLTFTIDSSALAGLPAQLAFDLIDGTAASDSRVAIRDFSTDGVLGLSSAVGGVTGSLSGDVAMSDAGFFNEFLQALTLSASLTFTVDATTHIAGVIPGEWSLLMLDAAGTAPLVHTDMLGDALILLEFDGTPEGRLWTATRTTPVVPISVTTESLPDGRAVPEPGTLSLLGLGTALLLCARARRGQVMPVKNSTVARTVRAAARWPRAYWCVIALLAGAMPGRVHAQDLTTVDSSRIDVRFSGFVFNRSTDTFDTLATVTNTSDAPLRGPMALVLDSIDPSVVTLQNPDGTIPALKPFVGVPLLPAGLSPRSQVSAILLQFSNPTRRAFTFRTSIVTGQMPSTQDLIGAALVAHRIDYVTSLEYRVFALSRDPRLPPELTGGGNEAEDVGLFAELQAVWPTLSNDVHQRLEAFLVRPDDPRSIFGPRAAALGRAATVPQVGPYDTGCHTFWIGLPTAAGHAVTHLCATADGDADAEVRSVVGRALDRLWPEMTKEPPLGMGKPVPDTRGGDSRLDLYIVSRPQCVLRGSLSHPNPADCAAIGSDTLAEALTDMDFDPPKNSFGRRIAPGFILIDRARVHEPMDLQTDLAHELFHVLQYAHNIEAMAPYTDLDFGNGPLRSESWFIEASATWAEWNYVPESSSDPQSSVHQTWFVPLFQTRSTTSLQASGSLHKYAAYIWLFFMQQERGAEAVFRAWVASEAAADPDGIDAAIDAQVSFRDRFRDFAVRNLNEPLPGDPISPRYVGLDPAFPDGVIPDVLNDMTVVLSSSPPLKVFINPLAAQYDHFSLVPEVRHLVFDFSGLHDPQPLDLDFVMRVRGTWKRVAATGAKVQFCRDLPDEDVDTLFLVLSDHERATADPSGIRYAPPIDGTYTVTGDAACQGWAGTAEAVHTAHTLFADGRGNRIETTVDEEQRWLLDPETTTAEAGPLPGEVRYTIGATVTATHHLTLHQVEAGSCGSTLTDVEQTGSNTVHMPVRLFIAADGHYVAEASDVVTAGILDALVVRHVRGFNGACVPFDDTTTYRTPVGTVGPGSAFSTEAGVIDPAQPDHLIGLRVFRIENPGSFDQLVFSWNFTRFGSTPK